MAEESKEQYEFKKKVKELKAFSGRGTELISVYVTPGYSLSEIAGKLRDEQGQASNIKSKATRQNVCDALEKILQYLKGFKQTPRNGVAIFAGNVSRIEGKPDLRLFSVEPPAPLGVQFYRCESRFVLEPLEEMLASANAYGLVLVDGKDATVAILRGKNISVVKRLHSTAQQKVSKGGQCVHEDALVQLGDGRVAPIKDVVEGDAVFSCDFGSLEAKSALCERVFKRRAKSAFLIRTKNPLTEVVVTPEHNFFVVTENGFEEKSAAELREGDFLLLARRIRFNGDSVAIDAQIPSRFVVGESGRRLLAEKRGCLSLSQRQAGESVGMRQADVWELENEEMGFGPRHERLLGFYGLSAQEFVGGFASATPLAGFPVEMQPDLARLLGYFAGDGSVDGNRLVFYEADADVLNAYRETSERLFGVGTALKERKEKGYFELKVYSKYVVDAFKTVFPELARKNTFREVPVAVQKSSPECVAAFVRGVFDAEGSASGGRVSLAMANKRVVQTLQFLLLRFGIISSFSSKNTRAPKQQYYVSISDGESLKRFASAIGFSSKKKQAALQEFVRVGRKASYCDEPPVDGGFVRRLAAGLGLNTKRFSSSHGFIGGRRQVSREVFSRRVISVFEERLREIVGADENDFGRLRKGLRIKMSDVAAAVGVCTSAILNMERGKSDYREAEALDFLKREKLRLESSCREALRLLKTLQDSDFLKAKIIEKKRIALAGLFYDLTVPSTSDFIVNGIVVHNSARRYQRIHEESSEVYYKRIGEAMNAFVGLKNFDGVIVGGPGPSKEDFLKLKPFNYQLKVLGVLDTGYSDEPGLRELLEKSGDLIHEQEAVREKRLFGEFMREASTGGGLAVYGLDEVEAALAKRQVKRLIVSEDLRLKRFAYKCSACPREGERIAEEFEERDCECGGKEQVAEEEDVTQALLDEAEKQGVPVEVFSRETDAGSEFYATFRGLGAFLKYK